MKYLQSIHWRFAVAALAVAMGIYLTVTPPSGTPAKGSAAYLATERALDRKLPELKWTETSLNSALTEIERGSGVTIRYDLDSLRQDGIDPARVAVTARLRDVRARKALEVVLDDAGAPRSRFRSFIADDGTVVVTTPRGDAKRAVTRIYNISDFFDQLPSPSETPEQAARTQAQLNEDISRLITETVDPKSWIDVGGDVGRLSISNGILTVHQTPERLWFVESLLEQVRDSQEPERMRWRLQEDP